MKLKHVFCYRSDRLTAQECLDHPWISGEAALCPSILPPVNADDQTDAPFSRESPARRSYACISCAQCGAQCSHNDDHRHKKTSVVEILLDRGIICWYIPRPSHPQGPAFQAYTIRKETSCSCNFCTSLLSLCLTYYFYKKFVIVNRFAFICGLHPLMDLVQSCVCQCCKIFYDAVFTRFSCTISLSLLCKYDL